MGGAVFNKRGEDKIMFVDHDGSIFVEHTLQCFHLLNKNPYLRLKSRDMEVQHRIDLFYETRNLAVFMSPTKKEFETEFGERL